MIQFEKWIQTSCVYNLKVFDLNTINEGKGRWGILFSIVHILCFTCLLQCVYLLTFILGKNLNLNTQYHSMLQIGLLWWFLLENVFNKLFAGWFRHWSFKLGSVLCWTQTVALCQVLINTQHTIMRLKEVGVLWFSSWCNQCIYPLH